MTTTPNTKSALALALIAGAMAGTDSFPLPPGTASSAGSVLYWPVWDMPPTHCPRCAAPMVRVRTLVTGALVETYCDVCDPIDPDRRWLRHASDVIPDGRDWRRLQRWRAVRGKL